MTLKSPTLNFVNPMTGKLLCIFKKIMCNYPRLSYLISRVFIKYLGITYLECYLPLYIYEFRECYYYLN